MSARQRLDVELVRRGLVETRQQAHVAIEAGTVLVSGAPATKAGRLVGRGEPIEMLGPAPRFVSRGGEKLDAALARFPVEVAGRRAVDVGASTGGFTDCLLQRGAAHVTAVDVGYGQLHERLRRDRRVTLLERTNVRYLTAGEVGGRVPLVVADVSFISLRTITPVLVGELAEPGGDLVLLVKPQFEAGRAEASRGAGVITDPDVWLDTLRGVASALQRAGAVMMDAMVSPLRGGHGNVEFLVRALVDATARPSIDLAATVAEASGGAEGRWLPS